MTSDGDGDGDGDGESSQRPTVAPPARARATPERIEGVTLGAPLGDGWFAATDDAGRRVEVAVLPDLAGPRRDRLLREARAVVALRHANLVAYRALVGDAAVIADAPDGVDLATWLAARPRSWRAIVAAFVAVGRGLAAAHAAGIVHRAVDARHVHVDARGVPRLGRAGLAAPPADARDDDRALCGALWQALHGAPPPAARRRVPPALTAALRRGLATAPDDRFGSTDELVAALAAATRLPRRARTALAAAATVAAMAGAAALAAAAGAFDPAAPPTAAAPLPAAPPPPRDYAADLARIAQLPDPAAVLRALGALPDDALALPLAGELATDAVTAGPMRVLHEAAPVTAIALTGDSSRVAVGTTIDTVVHTLDGSRPDIHLAIAAPTALSADFPINPALRALVDDDLVQLLADGTLVRYPACPGHAHVLAHTPDLRMVACPTTLPSGRAGQAAVDATESAQRVIVEGLEVVAMSSDDRVAIREDDDHVVLRDLYLPALPRGRHELPPHALLAMDPSGVAILSGRELTWWEPNAGKPDLHYELPFDSVDSLAADSVVAAYVIAGARAAGRAALVSMHQRYADTWQLGEPIEVLDVPSRLPDSIVVQTAHGLELVATDLGWTVRATGPDARGGSLIADSVDGRAIATAAGDRVAIWLPVLAPPRSASMAPVGDTLPAVAPDGRELAAMLDGGVVVTTLAIETTATLPRSAKRLVYGRDRTLAGLEADGTVWAWCDDAPRTLGRVARARDVIAVSCERALAIDADKHLSAVAGGGAAIACGGRVVDRAVAATAIVRGGTGGRAACDIASGELRALPPADDVALSTDGARIALVSGGVLSVVTARSLEPQPFPYASGIARAILDEAGTHALLVSPSGLAVAVARGTEPIALANSAGVTEVAISPDGTRVAARRGRDLLAWDIDEPSRARPVGRLFYDEPLSGLVVTPRVVVAVHAGLRGLLVVTAWQIGPAKPAEIRGWARLVGP